MITLSKSTGRRLIDIHGWSGVLFGLVLYIVVFSGAIVVFSHEIGAWSVSEHKWGEGLNGKIDQRLVELAANLPSEYKDEVTLRPNALGELVVFFHTHVKDENGVGGEKGTRFILDPNTLAVISENKGFRDNLPLDSSGFLESFLLKLHIQLYIPAPAGLYLTGILGLVLLVSAISGFIIHRHLIKDIFLSPRRNTRLLNTRDRHNLAGTWSILFSIVVAFTGAFFSFATTLGLPIIAMTAFGGDQDKAMVAVIGKPAIVDSTPKPFIGIENIIKQSKQADIGDSLPISVAIERWGRADSIVTTIHEPTDDNLFYSIHKFNGVTGRHLGEKPRVGDVPSAGNVLVEMMSVLHFGFFAGLLSRIIWLSLGLATCYVIISGLQLWVQRREQEDNWQPLAKLIPTTGYGLPIAIVGAAIGFVLTFSNYSQQVEKWTINGFLIGVVLSFIIGFTLQSADKSKQRLQQLLAVGLILLPIIRAVSHQTYLEDMQVTAMDISLILSGVMVLFVSMKRQTSFIKIKASS